MVQLRVTARTLEDDFGAPLRFLLDGRPKVGRGARVEDEMRPHAAGDLAAQAKPLAAYTVAPQRRARAATSRPIDPSPTTATRLPATLVPASRPRRREDQRVDEQRPLRRQLAQREDAVGRKHLMVGDRRPRVDALADAARRDGAAAGDHGPDDHVADGHRVQRAGAVGEQGRTLVELRIMKRAFAAEIHALGPVLDGAEFGVDQHLVRLERPGVRAGVFIPRDEARAVEHEAVCSLARSTDMLSPLFLPGR